MMCKFTALSPEEQRYTIIKAQNMASLLFI
ncbi:hypothetical protein BC749_11518 [Flavobacterium araucananum]|nr:hypothetical protein BC749_11518 [Flavobacterium araucananum]